MNPDDAEICAPGKLFEDGSCISLDVLIEMAKAFNEENPNNIIKMNNNYEILNPSNYKKYLVRAFKEKLGSKCKSQHCWTEQSFIRKMKENQKEELKNDTFKPEGPEGKFEWLNTVNINEVMEQYENTYPEFKFLGAVPIDFDDLPALGIKNLDVDKLYKEGKTKLGIVFNLDEHWKSGSHWTALYTDMKGGKIYYFDSYGSKPPERVRVLMRRLARFYQTGRGIRNPDADYNKMRHQYKNSECGVYSMNFIIRMLRGTTLEEVNSIRVSDEKINKCRRKYFR
jgi:hypothetical protein